MPMANKTETKSFFSVNEQKYKKYIKRNLRTEGIAQMMRSRLKTTQIQQ